MWTCSSSSGSHPCSTIPGGTWASCSSSNWRLLSLPGKPSRAERGQLPLGRRPPPPLLGPWPPCPTSSWLMQMRSRGQASQHRPIMPTGATNGPPRQQQQPRYPQPLAYQQPIYSQPPAYYGGGRGGAGLAPLGPGMMDAAPVDYRPARRSDPVGSDLPTYAQHDYRDGPHPNYEVGPRRSPRYCWEIFCDF